MWIGVGVGGLLVVGLVIFGAISFLSNGDEGGQVAGGGPQSSDDPAAAVPGGWSVQADASQDTASLSGDPAVEISIPAGASMDWAVYPETSNAFVALGSNFRNDDVREVWDLRSGRKVGAISTDVGAQRGVLSPDGLHFVAMAKSKDKLLVFDVKAGKQVGEIKIPSATVSPVMRFAGPSRLVTLQRKEPLGVWSIPEGQREQSIELTKLFQINSLAVSPGGRFAAAVVNDDDSNKSVLRIYDLDAGKLAGGISLQSYAEATNLMCESLAFSPDGGELAGVLKTYADGGKQWLVGWDMKSGKPAFEHDVATDLQTKAVSGTNSSPQVRWFPDQKWFLLFGRYVFDREVGGPIWRVPDDKELTGEATNVAGNNQVLVVSGPHKKRVVHAIALPRDEIAASSAAVSAGGLAEDAGLPAITTADSSGVKTVELSDAPVPWEVEADPPPPAKGPFLETPLAVDAAADSIGSVLLSSVESARAIVAQDRFADQSVIACYELTEGSEPQSFEITFGTEALALSPDGARLLTRAKHSTGRLDVWSVPDGEHVLGWRPHQQEKEAVAKVVAARFVDATHVLSLSAGRKLTLWELPSCRAVYRIENVAQSSVPSPYSLQMTRVLSLRDAYQPGSASSTARAGDSDPVQPHPSPGLPAISPNGRTIALLYAGRMTFLDSLSGDVRGSVSVAGGLGAAAFDPSGTKAAAVLTRPGGGALVSINLADGKITDEFPLPVSGSWLHWSSESTLLLDNMRLIDVKSRTISWKYDSRGAIHSPNSPDGRHYGLLPASSDGRTLTLAALRLPDSTVQNKIDSALSAPEMILEKGKTLSLQITFADKPPGDSQFENNVRKHLTEQLAAAGIEVANGPLTLLATLERKNTGRQMTFRRLGGGGATGSPQETPISEVRIDCKLAIAQAGVELWSESVAVSNHKIGLTRLKPGETIQKHLQEQQWNAVTEFFTKVPLPSHLFPESAKQGLGSSTMSATGSAP